VVAFLDSARFHPFQAPQSIYSARYAGVSGASLEDWASDRLPAGIPDLVPSKSERLSRGEALATLKRGSDFGYSLLQQAKEQNNYTMALDIIEEAADRGIRPPAAYWEVAVETLKHIRDPNPALRLHGSLRQWGYDCSVSVIKALLEIYATTRCSKGVHMIVKAIQNSTVQLSDPVLERLAFAYFSIGLLDRCFKIVDMYRATGGPSDRILFYIISSIPHIVIRPGEGRRQVIQGLYRKVMNYLLLTPNPLPAEINTLARSFTFSSPLHNDLNLRSMLPELLSHKKITDALQTDVLLRVLTCLLGSSQVRYAGRSSNVHSCHTLEDFALGNIPSSIGPYAERRNLFSFLFPDTPLPQGLENDAAALMAVLPSIQPEKGFNEEMVDVVPSSNVSARASPVGSSGLLTAESSDSSSTGFTLGEFSGSEDEGVKRPKRRPSSDSGKSEDAPVKRPSRQAKAARALQDRVLNYVNKTKTEYTGPLYGSMEVSKNPSSIYCAIFLHLLDAWPSAIEHEQWTLCCCRVWWH
jgi:hypothetical protein